MRNYNTHARRRSRLARRFQGYFYFALCAASILLLALAITKILESGQNSRNASQNPAASDTVSKILAPLPMQSGGGGAASAEFGPVWQQPGDYTLLARNMDTIALPERGQVSLDYFSDAAFVGDSLTEGFTEYSINLSGALVCGYIGIGPDTIVNRTTVKHPERGNEVVLDVLSAGQPKKVYVLLGTNTLVDAGSDDKFLAYYGQMLDAIRASVGENAIIYVQAIPPVRPEVAAEKPGLASSNLQTVNASLAAMADEKGCRFLNLWDVMADSDGNLKAEYASNDGIHFTAGDGYTAWVNYLRSHTVYASDNEWTPGTAFAS